MIFVFADAFALMVNRSGDKVTRKSKLNRLNKFILRMLFLCVYLATFECCVVPGATEKQICR